LISRREKGKKQVIPTWLPTKKEIQKVCFHPNGLEKDSRRETKREGGKGSEGEKGRAWGGV